MQPSEPERRSPPELPRARVIFESEDGTDGVEVEVEVAHTDATRRRGLMFRRSMPSDHGMLFLFDREEHQSFWMRNTFLRLDIIFLDGDRRVVGVIEDAPPLTTESRAVEADSQYVLEVHGGFSRTHGIGPGTRARFSDLPEDIE